MQRRATILLLAFALLAPCVARADSLAERARRDELARVPHSDPAMRAAMDKARATLDGFLAKLKSPPPGTDHYAVKVGIAEKGFNEFFWLTEIKAEGERLTATINNQPREVTRVKYGQRYSFARSEIVDWTYVDMKAHRMMGNFTACALLTHESPADREAMKREYGLVCD